MSYRIYVNKYQCLGNNECPQVLIEELKKQGCEMDAEKCFKDFEIKELQPIIEALEQYIIDMNDKYQIADFSDIIANRNKRRDNGLTWKIEEILDCGYLFVTINFLNAIKDDYEEYYDTDDKKRLIKYRIKEGRHVYMSAY